MRATGFQGRVRVAAGPWRIQERWWSRDERVERAEWDVELEDGELIRLVRDEVRGEWFVEGDYD